MGNARVQLKGSARPAPCGKVLGSVPDPNELASITVVVRRRRALPDPANSGELSRNELAAEFGADPADLERVADFAVAQGLHVDRTDPASRTVHLSGNLTNLARAFGTDLQLYRQDDRTFRGRTGTLSIPADLEDIIQGVFGLDQRPQARAHPYTPGA